MDDRIRVLSSGGQGEASPRKRLSFPPQKKSFPEKKLKAILNTDLIIKKSVRVTNVQKCDFSQS